MGGTLLFITQLLQNRKTGGSDGIVSKLLKYGGSEIIMVDLFEKLFSVTWQEIVPRQWRGLY